MNKDRLIRLFRFEDKICKSSILKTLFLNILFLIIASGEYYMLPLDLVYYDMIFKNSLGIRIISIVCCVMLLKNYIILILVEIYGIVFKPIKNKNRQKPIENFFGEFHVYMWMVGLLEGITLTSLILFFPFSSKGFNIWDYLMFFPIMFLFELIFDFFHYWSHRLSHSGILYKKIHKIHHKHRYPTPITTFYQHPLDVVLSNSIPSFFTFSILMYLFGINITYFQLSLISCWKTVIEIGGHLGKKVAPASSFPQFVWLGKWLGWELYIEDHDHHHEKFTCNYSKRFSLWDKFFGTYTKSEELL